jgi:hypothetical protein
MIAEPLTFHDELRRYERALMTYCYRHYLATYPKDLLRWHLRTNGAIPSLVASCAFDAWKVGKKPGPLYKGPPHFPQLRVIDGGRSESRPHSAGLLR